MKALNVPTVQWAEATPEDTSFQEFLSNKSSQYFQEWEQVVIGTKLVPLLILDNSCMEIVKYKHLSKLKKHQVSTVWYNTNKTKYNSKK